MRQVLGWTERGKAGQKVEVEASRERNQWLFTRRMHRDLEWEPMPEPSVHDWEQLLDLIERKYQRRRCAWRDVEQVREFLEEARIREPAP